MTSHVDRKRAPARKSPGSAIRAPFEKNAREYVSAVMVLKKICLLNLHTVPRGMNEITLLILCTWLVCLDDHLGCNVIFPFLLFGQMVYNKG